MNVLEVDLNEIMCNDNEAWINTNNAEIYHHVTIYLETTLSAKYAHFNGKLYFLKQREGCSYVTMIVPNYGCLL